MALYRDHGLAALADVPDTKCPIHSTTAEDGSFAGAPRQVLDTPFMASLHGPTHLPATHAAFRGLPDVDLASAVPGNETTLLGKGPIESKALRAVAVVVERANILLIATLGSGLGLTGKLLNEFGSVNNGDAGSVPPNGNNSRTLGHGADAVDASLMVNKTAVEFGRRLTVVRLLFFTVHVFIFIVASLGFRIRILLARRLFAVATLAKLVKLQKGNVVLTRRRGLRTRNEIGSMGKCTPRSTQAVFNEVEA
mmetsp:Transcript_16702/g.30242  ORF Transcript_16702/g.30242 Transcript_16702/m.30242 type:complete len:252 (+) Transcript_16702:682-1437(+)